VFWFKRRFEVLLLPRFGAKKSAKSRKRCRLRAKKTINKGKLQTALKVLGALNSLFKFAILHQYTKHKFIAGIDKTAL
jgi:DNA integration/recombination/inversion protein